jgi:bacterioferritin-associated ferredoxin
LAGEIPNSTFRIPKSLSVELDEELCLCFHVTKRKVLNYLRVEQPSRAGQLSDCFGAGTGCGWCRPYLCRLFDEARQAPGAARPADDSAAANSPAAAPPDPTAAEPTAAEYARRRAQYIRAGGGTPPPGATPPGPE